ncbi:MAG: UDP-3-O-acyl-N-acetylglucosamine deacetylase [Alphaproteobacteria bacterium]
MVYQRTLKSAISCAGVGLHSGNRIRMTLHPAAAGSGIVFRRTDLGGATLAATYENVSATMMRTNLGDDNGLSVATVEHLMSALVGLGIDNLVIDVDGPEVPIMDGSAAPFVFLIECAGIVEQDQPRRAIQVLKPVVVWDGKRSISLSPSDRFSISFEIDYPHPLIGRQSCFFVLEDGAFERELSRARTYGFLRDIGALRARGLALGGSLENAIVLDDHQVLNGEGLRYHNELVRHKVLDCIGDLYLAGAPLLGHLHGIGSGHSMNHRLLTALFDDDEAWRSVYLDGATLGALVRWQDTAVAIPA